MFLQDGVHSSPVLHHLQGDVDEGGDEPPLLLPVDKLFEGDAVGVTLPTDVDCLQDAGVS